MYVQRITVHLCLCYFNKGIDRQAYRQTYKQTYRQTNRQTYRQTYKQTYRQTNRQTYKQTNRQRDTEVIGYNENSTLHGVTSTEMCS